MMAAALLALVGAVVMIATVRWWATAFFTLIMIVTLLGRGTGLILGEVEVQTYDLVVLGVFFLGLLMSTRRPNFLLFLPFLLVLYVGALLGWMQSAELWENTVYLTVGVAAWGVGRFLAANYEPGGRHDRAIVYTVAAVILIQVAITALQSMGVEVFSLQGRSAELEGGRANGTFSHPGTVGKVMILFTAILLPFTQTSADRIRRLSYLSLILALIPVGLSESRANFIGYLIALLLWFFIMPGRAARTSRLVAPAIVVMAALIFSGTIIDRFQNDPEGGARQHFTDVAIAAISRTPWFGVGPGNYIGVVGQTDPLTAQGWRVHNVFLLQVTELGIVGAALFFLPAIVLAAISIRAIRRLDTRGSWARAFLASAAGTVITAVTGWGLMNGSIFILWFFCMGFSFGMIRRVDLDLPHEPSTELSHTKRANAR